MNQIQLHHRVDEILAEPPKASSLDDLRSILINKDIVNYLFTSANKDWLNWLWKNDFFNGLKESAKDPNKYSYRTPELNYLLRMATEDPSGVIQVMEDIPISSENFNPEVVDQFLRICSQLPAKELSQIVEKIKEEEWPVLMYRFNQWGFEYKKMLKTLKEAEDHESILILAESILSIRSKKEMKSKKYKFIGGGPFYFNDLESTQVFEHLISVPEKYLERALELCTNKMEQIVFLEEKLKESDIYDFKDLFALLDVDFFDLKVGGKHISYGDNIRELAAVIKELAERLVGSKFNEPREAKRIYKSYIDSLPKNRTMWRLKLFILSLFPEAFKEELTAAFFKLFEVKSYYDVTSGTEYKKALKKSFYVLDEDKKNAYFKKLETWPKEVFEKGEAYELLSLFSMILDHFPEQKQKAIKEVMSKYKFDYEPRPAIGQPKSGFVISHAPITEDEFNKLSVEEIAKKIRSEWEPEKLREMNDGDDFMEPLNAEGVGNLLKEDMPKRLKEYIDHSNLFFERGVLDEHYTYTFLSTIEDVLRKDEQELNRLNWNALFSLLSSIKNEGKKRAFDWGSRGRDTFDRWLAGWRSVHSSMAQIIKELLKQRSNSIEINFVENREVLLDIIEYLLRHPEPESKDDELETATSKTSSSGKSNYVISDPFTIAINSVRGKAFEAFLQFLYRDKKHREEGVDTAIANDIKQTYENLLEKENTRAIMFMFGHYLPSFYFRDNVWIKGLFKQIFPKEKKRHHLYTAAWEGFLANNLYKELFQDKNIQSLYMRALDEKFDSNPKQRYFKEPNEGLATHLALAYVNYDEFDFGHKLFDSFWKANSERQAKFINFTGRSYVAGGNPRMDHQLKSNPSAKEKLVKLWDWMVNNCSDEIVLQEFGFWISLGKGLFEMDWLAKKAKETLEKSGGQLSWEIGLMDSIEALAEKCPVETLEILRLYLLEGGVRQGKNRVPFQVNEQWYQAFNALYSNPNRKIKDKTYKLIDNLIREGGSAFWKLKGVLDNED